MEKKLISVVTVCLNAEKDIEYTINSILNQSFADYEYLIIDGQSDDATVEIAEIYKARFLKKGISFRIISEKDEGLYDAMNKAAEYVNGQWIIYINAGDALFDDAVLAHLASEISDDTDVLYGDVVLLDHRKYKLLKSGGVDRFKSRNPVCHQASLTKADVIRKFRFNGEYEIAADFDLFLRICLSNDKAFKKIDYVFAIYPLGGVSNAVSKREKEFDASRKQNKAKRVAFPHLQMMWIVLVEKIRKAAIKILGEGFYSRKRGWYSDKAEAAAQEK